MRKLILAAFLLACSRVDDDPATPGLGCQCALLDETGNVTDQNFLLHWHADSVSMASALCTSALGPCRCFTCWAEP